LTPAVGNITKLAETVGEFELAEKLYRRSAALSPDAQTKKVTARVCNNLAFLIALKGDTRREALEFVERAIALDGPGAAYLDTRGVVRLKAGELQFAIEDLTKSIELAPAPATYFHLAQAYFGTGDKAKAKKSLAEASKTDGWQQNGLHGLERDAYRKLSDDLRAP
jgi:tetratricopeptide (TPR) repeat protein